MRKILYFGSSKGIGLTYHLTKAAKYFHKLEGIELEVVSGVKEQSPALFDELTKNNVPCKKIKGIDEIEHFNASHREFLNYVKSFSPVIIGRIVFLRKYFNLFRSFQEIKFMLNTAQDYGIVFTLKNYTKGFEKRISHSNYCFNNFIEKKVDQYYE